MVTYTSPTTLNKNINKLIQLIGSEFEYEFVPIIPEAYATNRHCYHNVEKKVQLDGGTIQYGWSIYQSEYMCEAEKHAVWCNQNDDLIDITPNEVDGIKQIMFIPDDRQQSFCVDSKRVNLTDSKAIDTLIQLFTINVELANKYSTRMDAARIDLPVAVMELYEEIKRYIEHYQNFSHQKLTKLTKCYCDSGKSYNNCHANITIKLVNQKVAKLSTQLK